MFHGKPLKKLKEAKPMGWLLTRALQCVGIFPAFWVRTFGIDFQMDPLWAQKNRDILNVQCKTPVEMFQKALINFEKIRAQESAEGKKKE